MFKKNFKYAVFNVTTLPRKMGHFFRTVEGDCDNIVTFKFTKLRLIILVDRNNIGLRFWHKPVLLFSWHALVLSLYIDYVTCDWLKCDCCRWCQNKRFVETCTIWIQSKPLGWMVFRTGCWKIMQNSLSFHWVQSWTPPSQCRKLRPTECPRWVAFPFGQGKIWSNLSDWTTTL